MGSLGRKHKTEKDSFCSHLNLIGCSMVSRKPSDSLRLILTTAIGIILGFIVGVYISLLSVSKVCCSANSYLILQNLL